MPTKTLSVDSLDIPSYRLEREGVSRENARRAECDFWGTRACHNVAAWAEAYERDGKLVLPSGHITKRCHRHRRIDTQTAKRSAWRSERQYLPYDGRDIALRTQADEDRMALARQDDETYRKAQRAAKWLLQTVETTPEVAAFLATLSDENTLFTVKLIAPKYK